MNRLRIKTKTQTITLNLLCQIAGLIIRIPPDLLDKTETIDQTHRHLGPKFNRTFGLATNNGTNVRLMQADNPVCDTVRLTIIHQLLLPKQFLDHQQ